MRSLAGLRAAPVGPPVARMTPNNTNPINRPYNTPVSTFQDTTTPSTNNIVPIVSVTRLHI